MSQQHVEVATDSIVYASRPVPEREIAQQVRFLIDHMLGDGFSVIDPNARIWTVEAAEELRRRIEDNPLTGSRGQWDKLDEQLSGASREVMLLAAELVFLRDHPVRTALPATRREHLERILSHLDDPVRIPPEMSAALDRPSDVAGFKAGQGYWGGLWLHLIWSARFVRHWAGLPESDRTSAATDPWQVQRQMLASGPDRPDIRNAMQFLIAPEVFEPITSAKMKREIRDGLADRIEGVSGDSPDAIDRDLLAIRSVLAREIKGPFHYWTTGVKELWQPDPSASTSEDDSVPPESRPTHYWIYSPGRGASEWPEFSAAGIMAIGWDELGDLAQYPDREAIRQALDVDNSGDPMSNNVLALWQFQHEMAEGDIVYAKRGRDEIVGRGVVRSAARFEPDRASYHHVRSVEWTHVGVWTHPRKAVMKTLTDITADRDYVEDLQSVVVGDDEPDPEPTPTPTPGYDKQAFLNEVFLSAGRYDRLRSLVMRKKNVILAGPPGVGKTFVAKRLAYSIIGAKDPNRVQMVQFHQSYSYEDFVMGYRPTESGGFTLAEGPFYRFCETARADDPERPYFFIIDEINRGNISKILGELLLLIEADKRGQQLRLLYKNETFSVPPNLFIIGMMNTADRSLAVLDYALRRRFGFFEMSPAFESDGFTDWQKEAGSPTLDRLVATVVQLNSAISDDPALGKGFSIGHSYLTLPQDVSVDQAWLISVVEDELIPLLQEYWFDEGVKVEEWSAKLRNAVA